LLFGFLFAAVWKVRKMKLAAEEMLVSRVASKILKNRKIGYSFILLPMVKDILVKVKNRLEKEE